MKSQRGTDGELNELWREEKEYGVYVRFMWREKVGLGIFFNSIILRVRLGMGQFFF
jgi:hypothetical protein